MVSEGAKAVLWKEALDKYRNRWIQMSALALLVFTLGISYFGGSPAGVVGFRKFEAIFVSLLTLVTYIIPLVALLLGSGVLSEERERGTLDILLASGLDPRDLWIGKFLGYSLVLGGAVLGGYLPALLLLTLKFGSHTVPSLVLFTLSSLILGVSMIGMALLVSALLVDRVRVLSAVVLLWLVLVILYDLSLLGLLVLTKGMVSKHLFTALLVLNPVDLFRIINLTHAGELKAILGFATVDLPPYVRPPTLWTLSVLWAFAPVAVGYWIFKRRLWR
jgi:Cu-processing system permease protein